jgi:hypothetical protein
VGSSDTGFDKGVESTSGYNVIDGIDMIKKSVHFIRAAIELSFRGIPFCRVTNASVYIFPGDFNTKISREIVANPSAKHECVIQILIAIEEIVPYERIQFNASCLYLGASRQG